MDWISTRARDVNLHTLGLDVMYHIWQVLLNPHLPFFILTETHYSGTTVLASVRVSGTTVLTSAKVLDIYQDNYIKGFFANYVTFVSVTFIIVTGWCQLCDLCQYNIHHCGWTFQRCFLPRLWDYFQQRRSFQQLWLKIHGQYCWVLYTYALFLPMLAAIFGSSSPIYIHHHQYEEDWLLSYTFPLEDDINAMYTPKDKNRKKWIFQMFFINWQAPFWPEWNSSIQTFLDDSSGISHI